MRKIAKKLALRSDTVRSLSSMELGRAAGGFITSIAGGTCDSCKDTDCMECSTVTDVKKGRPNA